MRAGLEHARLHALLVLALAACGTDAARDEPVAEAEAAMAGETIDACSLLSPEQVSAAVGEPMNAGTLAEHGGRAGESYFSTCTYAAVAETSLAAVTITVRPSPEITDPTAALEAQVADMRANVMPDYRLEPVEGLGAAAGWDPSLSQLTAFRSGLALLVDVGGPLSDRRRAAVELARIALQAAH
ncbi:MAG TPA: hypothetical protein VK939_09455 [Longimicrobiales bacterium]|nr:hypothetical protein [Longimicrobiales bacterium]